MKMVLSKGDRTHMRKTIITANKGLAVLGLAAVMLAIPGSSVQAAGVAVNAKNFPDTNFRNYVNDFVDKDNNGKLSGNELKKVKSIYLPYDQEKRKVKNLEGIQYFTSLEILDCQQGKLTKLDVSRNKKLKMLNCDSNRLKNLNVSKNTKLEDLSCCKNKLTKLDISKNLKLKTLNCGWNKLKNLNVGKNEKLVDLYCYSNNLSKLEVGKNQKLEVLSCYSNNLKSLNVNKNKKLDKLYCYLNKIKKLDLKKNKQLSFLSCDEDVKVKGYTGIISNGR